MKEYIYFTDPMHLALAEALKGKVFDKQLALRMRPDKQKTERRQFDPSLHKIYVRYMIRAEKRKVTFDLTVDVFIKTIEQDCAYCGVENAGGVDMVDSKKGYTENNIAPCCAKCNMMKHTLTVDVFKEQIKRINSHLTK